MGKSHLRDLGAIQLQFSTLAQDKGELMILERNLRRCQPASVAQEHTYGQLAHPGLARQTDR